MKLITDPSDSDLLRSMLAGDEEALTLLYHRRQGGVYRFALQMSGSKSIAEDVTQEVFLFLMREGHVFDPARGSLSAFLFGVARNYVLRRLRVEHLLAPLGDESDDDTPLLQTTADLCPLEDLTRAETIESVRKAVLSLPAKYREVVVLCELQDVSYGETAEILGCAIGTVRSRLHRARALLLAKLRPVGEFEEAGSATVKSARCQKFESVVSELARGQMMAAEQRGEALAHSDACGDCATRLRDEEMLTRGLHSLATEMESLETPVGVEANLLKAFRAREVAIPIARRQSRSHYWLAAVAAMLLIAISVFVFRWTTRPVAEPGQAGNQQEPQRKPEVIQTPAPQLVQDFPDDDLLPPRQQPRKRIRPASHRRPNAQVANHVTNEVATDFIPLSYMSTASLQDGGQIVRVQLPRSALANFGLPVNMDRYNEKVKADVLFGVDGTARAIRFVQ